MTFTIEEIMNASERLQARLQAENVDIANLQGVHIESVITDLLNELTDMPAAISPVGYRIAELQSQLENWRV